MDLVPGLTTVGMSAFNSAGTIEAAIDSILTQSDPQLELLIIDACSTDQTPTICEHFAARDHRVTFTRLSEQRRWYGNARDHLSRAKGEFFMWADADDVWASNWIASLKSVLIDPRLGGGFGVLTHIDNNSIVISDHVASDRTFKFASKGSRFERILGYVAEPEAAGKANLLYAMWRTEVLRSLDPWADAELARDSDIFFVLEAVSRVRIGTSTDTTVFRRLPFHPHDEEGVPVKEARVAITQHESKSLLLKPESWVAYEVPPGYFDRYASAVPLAIRPVVAVVLLWRTTMALMGKVVRRLS